MATLIKVNKGLGAYPTDPYYDPNRPSWLPYFIDTPTESEMKYSFLYGVTPGQVTGEAYAKIPSPPTVSAPPIDTWATAPSSAGEASSTVSNILNQQVIDWQKLGRYAINSNPNPPAGFPWLTVGLIAGAAVLVLAVSR